MSESKWYPDWLAWAGYVVMVVMAVVIVVVTVTAESPAPLMRPYDAAHASSCRVLHVIARNAHERVFAVMACREPWPNQFYGELNRFYGK